MTVKELQTWLEQFPDDADVYGAVDDDTLFIMGRDFKNTWLGLYMTLGRKHLTTMEEHQKIIERVRQEIEKEKMAE